MNIPLKSITETSLSEIYSLAFFSSNFNERQKYVVTIIIAVFKIIPNITIKNVLRIDFLLFRIRGEKKKCPAMLRDVAGGRLLP